MTNNQDICKHAFSLVTGRPEGAGLTFCLAAGEECFLLPELSAGGLEMSLLKAGLYRGPQRRPTTDLRVFVEDRGDKIVGHIERITGVAFLPTMIDPSEFVGHFEAESWASAETACARELGEKLPGVELSMTSVSYRHNKFGEKTFFPIGAQAGGQASAQAKRRGLRRLLFGAGKNQELVNFVEGVVGQAFDFSPEGLKAQKLSLWFTLDGECTRTIYVDIEPKGNRFEVSASDRSVWPWKEKAVRATAGSEFEVSNKISSYINRVHGENLRSLEVYFNWSEALQSRI